MAIAENIKHQIFCPKCNEKEFEIFKNEEEIEVKIKCVNCGKVTGRKKVNA